MAYPDGPAPALPDRHGGTLRVEASRCPEGCRECVSVCPTEAITPLPGKGISLDLGRCLFCAGCVAACPEGVLPHRCWAVLTHGMASPRSAVALRSRLRGRCCSR